MPDDISSHKDKPARGKKHGSTTELVGPWALAGNSGTLPDRNFLGTTDTQPLIVKTNGEEAMRVDVGGRVGIGSPTPQGTLDVASTTDFSVPQIQVTNERPEDFARIRFQTFGIDREETQLPFPLQAFDIAVGQNQMNIFSPVKGNLLSIDANGVTTVEVLSIRGGGDLAEIVEVEEESQVEPGTVLSIDHQRPGKLRISNTAYDHRVAGVVSGASGLEAGLRLHSDVQGGMPVAIAGFVYCKAEVTEEPIEPGDLLTTSGRPGHAMKSVDRERSYGAVLGKAITGLREGTGLVLVLVNLQ